MNSAFNRPSRRFHLSAASLVIVLAGAACGAEPGDEAITEIRSALASPAPLSTVLGETIGNSGLIPPDSNGAVSGSFILTTVNGFINVKNRSGALLFSQNRDAFWGEPNGAFDPQARFDPVAGRFIITSASNQGDAVNSRLLMAVTQTSDPTGAWHKFAIPADPEQLAWLDFPQLGYNGKWIVVSGANIGIPGGRSQDVLWIFNKAALYAGTNSFQRIVVDNTDRTLLRPAETYDSAQQDQFFLRNVTAPAGNVELVRLTGPIGSASLVAVGMIPSPTAFSFDEVTLPQAGGQPTDLRASGIDVQHVVLRNGSIWAVQNLVPQALPRRSSLQWLQIGTTGVLQSSGLVDDPSGQAMFFMPSLAVNTNNDFLIGYSRFSPVTFPSAAYSAHSQGDAPGSIRDPLVYRPGTAPYFADRWGDYSHTQVDPVNGTDFWTVQELSIGGSSWETWWAQVSGGPGPVCPSGVTTPRLNLQVRCNAQGTQAQDYAIRVVNWHTAPVTIGNLCVRAWAFEPATLNLSRWNNGAGQVCTPGGSCTNVTVGGRTATVANVPACTTNPTHMANQSVTYCTTSTVTIPANGGFWQTQSDGLRIGRNNPMMTGGNFADDYSHFGTGNGDCAAFSTFADNRFFDLYFNGGLVGEALSATSPDPNTGREPCTCE
jgi:hypothetical protein